MYEWPRMCVALATITLALSLAPLLHSLFLSLSSFLLLAFAFALA